MVGGPLETFRDHGRLSVLYNAASLQSMACRIISLDGVYKPRPRLYIQYICTGQMTVEREPKPKKHDLDLCPNWNLLARRPVYSEDRPKPSIDWRKKEKSVQLAFWFCCMPCMARILSLGRTTWHRCVAEVNLRVSLGPTGHDRGDENWLAAVRVVTGTRSFPYNDHGIEPTMSCAVACSAVPVECRAVTMPVRTCQFECVWSLTHDCRRDARIWVYSRKSEDGHC